MTNISWPQFAAQLLQIPQKLQVLDSIELFSVAHLQLYLARKCKTQQTCKQTVTTAGKIHTSHDRELLHHVITFVNETNGAFDGLKKKTF